MKLNGTESAATGSRPETESAKATSCTSEPKPSSAMTRSHSPSGDATSATCEEITPAPPGPSLKEEIHALRAWIAEKGLTLPEDWQEHLTEIRHGPAPLSSEDAVRLAMIRRNRRNNHMPSFPEYDFLLELVERLTR